MAKLAGSRGGLEADPPASDDHHPACPASEVGAQLVGVGAGPQVAHGRLIRARDVEQPRQGAGRQQQPWWPTGYDGSLRGLAGLKNLTSQLIGRFCAAAERATREAYGPAALTRYAARLDVPAETRLECAALKAVAAAYVMDRAEAEATRERQRTLVRELADALVARAPGSLGPLHRTAWEAADDDAGRLRAVVDLVASLTDPSATALHAQLTGERGRGATP